MKSFFREILLSISLSLILMFIFSVVLSTTSVSENTINPITIVITTFSLLICSFRISKEKKEKGIIYGSFLGLTYMIILYLISSIINNNYSFSINSIIMIILGIIGGAIGGIIGVNLQ